MSTNDEHYEEVTVLFQKWEGRLRGFLINLGAAPDLADEIVNFSFAQLGRYWEHLKTEQYRRYLHTIARNEFIRRQKRAKRDDAEPLSDTRCRVVVDFSGELIDRDYLRWALSQLPPREREAVLWRYYLNYTIKETASEMGISKGAVSRYCSEGLHKLQKLCQDASESSEAAR